MAHLYLPPPNGQKPPPWRNSPAKKVLIAGINGGEYPDSMTTEAIYGSQLVFRQYKWENFQTNLRNLRAALEREMDRANEDAANLAADMQQPNTAAAFGSRSRWVGSEAERLLKQDVDAGRHVGLQPQELRATRAEYKQWPLKTFRDHIQQEVRSRKTQAYWLHRDKKNSKNEPWPIINSK